MVWHYNAFLSYDVKPVEEKIIIKQELINKEVEDIEYKKIIEILNYLDNESLKKEKDIKKDILCIVKDVTSIF